MSVNVEGLLVAALKADVGLSSFSVSTQVPAGRKNGDRLITVERTGGPRDTFRDIPTVAVLVWAESRWEASEWASFVADRVESLAVTHPNVARVGIVSQYNNPDPDSGHARYQIVAELVTKA